MEEETLGACRLIELLSEIVVRTPDLIRKKVGLGCLKQLQLPTAPLRCHVLYVRGSKLALRGAF